MTPHSIRAILCPTDFSRFSGRALRHAVALASQRHARLKVLHVIPGVPSSSAVPPSFDAPLVVTEAMREQAEAETRRFVEPAVEARVAVETEVRNGEPWREILAAAEELPADLVVLGTHGRGGLERLVLGSVTEKLLRRLPCSVMTVCHEEGRTWEAPGLVRRILCAVDFSEASEATLAGALALAAEQQATVTLVHVVEPLPVGAEPFYFANSLREELVRNADQKLAGLARDAEARTGITVHERLATGRPFVEILRIAAEEQADLVVIGPGLGALDRFLWGSNAQHVVREATCPVLTMRGLAARVPAEEGRKAVALRAG